MKQWLKFIRFSNLVIILLTFYLIRYFLWLPFVNRNEVEVVLDDFSFFLLVFITMIVAAAGNIVNDIYDLKIDLINKPNQVFIDTIISKKNAWRLYFSLNALSLVLVIWLFLRESWWYQMWVALVYYVITLLLLWLYSYRFKKVALVGNLIVSAIVTFVPLSTCYPELANMYFGYIPVAYFYLNISIGYIVFAFTSTLLREIIKDMEDKDGDAQLGAKTLPVMLGLTISKRITFGIGLLLLFLIITALYWLFGNYLIFSGIYGIAGILLPLLFLLFKLYNASAKQHFHQLSQIAKIIMLMGLIFLIVSYFEFYY